MIKAFEENCGCNYFEIWKQTVVKSKTPRGIDRSMKLRIFQLILNINKQEGELPIQVLRWLSYFDRTRKIEIQNNWLVDKIETVNKKDQIDSNAQISLKFAKLLKTESIPIDKIKRITGLDDEQIDSL